MVQRIGWIAFIALATAGCATSQTLETSRSSSESDPTAQAQVQGPHIAAGTVLRARLNRFIDTTSAPGAAQPFEAVLLSELRTDQGDVLVPAGATVRGDLTWDEARHRVRLRDATVESIVGSLPVVAHVRSGALPTETAPARDRAAESRDPLARAGVPGAAGSPLSSREFRLPRGAEIQLVLARPLLAPGASVIRVR